MHRLLPRSRGLPQMPGGSAATLSLSRPAQASLALRPVGSLSCLKRPLLRSSSPTGYPTKPLVSFRINRQLSGWNLPRLMIRAFEVAPSRRTATHGHVVPVWGTYGMQMLLRGVTYSLSERVIAVPKAPKSGVYV